MKGTNSRLNHRPQARFSNLAHIQGGMVTDADLTEAGQIHQARGETLGRITAASGVPAKGGMVALTAGAVPSLQPGNVVAEGKLGTFAMISGADATLSARFAAQADLPAGPALPAGASFLYADLWERPVFAAEDARLIDPGLHGVETSYRTRTMVQIKALPLANIGDAVAAAAQLAAGTFPFLKHGTALATIQPAAADIAADDCDPCASTIEIERTLPNALFRLEVIAVARDAAGGPTATTLAWSLENAEAIESLANLADPTTADAFVRPPSAYEFFSLATDAQSGAFPGAFAALRPAFRDALSPIPAPVPPHSHVRRWDGTATVTLAGGAVSGKLGSGGIATVPGKIVVSLDAFSLSLDVAGKQMLAGDYWLVELRRFATAAQQLTLVGADAAGANALPHGIHHAFCPLFATVGDAAPAVSDATRRRLSMPPLSDLPADHIGYTPDCPTWYGPVENVQEALDALCNLPADKVFYEPPCPDWYGAEVHTVGDALDTLCNLPADKISFTPDADCLRFGGEPKVTNVAEALQRLCKVEDTAALSLVLRTMMDWGVVCGLRLLPATDGSVGLKWTAGTALDQTGRIVSVPAGSVNFTNEVVAGIDNAQQIQEKEGEVCLSMAFDGDGKMTLHLTDHATARGPDTNSMSAAIALCNLQKGKLGFGDTLTHLSANETLVIQKVNAVWAGYPGLKGSIGLTSAEAAIFDKTASGLAQDYAKLISEPEAAEIQDLWVQADKEYSVAGLAGASADMQRMQRAVSRVGVLDYYERRSVEDCACINGVTPCPPAPAKPSLVPLGCVKFGFFAGGLTVCNYCCRKQALTWRSYRYYNQRDFIADIFAKLDESCCTPVPPPEPGKFDGFIGDIYFDPGLELPYYPVTPPVGVKWPPKGDFRVPGGGYTDPVRPDYTTNVIPDIKTFPARAAGDILTGHGLELVKTIDIAADPDALGTALALAAGEKYTGNIMATPKAGDKVVMLTSGGKALDYVVVGEGGGRFIYQTKSDQTSQQLAITKAVEEAVKIAIPTRPAGTGFTGAGTFDTSALTTELATLSTSRDTMTADVTRLISEVSGLEARRDAAASGLDQISSDLAKLTLARDATLASIVDAQKAVADLQAVQITALTDIRAAAPIESLGLDARLTTQLKTSGIVTVKDLSVATAAQLRSPITASGITITATDLKRNAATFIVKR